MLLAGAAWAGSGHGGVTTVYELRAACESAMHRDFCHGYLIASLDRVRDGDTEGVCLPAIVDLSRLRDAVLDAEVGADVSAMKVIGQALRGLWACSGVPGS